MPILLIVFLGNGHRCFHNRCVFLPYVVFPDTSQAVFSLSHLLHSVEVSREMRQLLRNLVQGKKWYCLLLKCLNVCLAGSGEITKCWRLHVSQTFYNCWNVSLLFALFLSNRIRTEQCTSIFWTIDLQAEAWNVQQYGGNGHIVGAQTWLLNLQS